MEFFNYVVVGVIAAFLAGALVSCGVSVRLALPLCAVAAGLTIGFLNRSKR